MGALNIMENKTEKHLLKYEKVKEDIEKKIEEGYWDENEVILSENLMCEEYNVSRITIRRAIDDLVQEGKLYKIKGKGCFVEKKKHEQLPSYSFSGIIKKQGFEPSKSRVSWDIKKADKDVAEQLGISEDDSVYVLKTLYKADGEPYCVNTSIMPVELFPKLEFFDFDNTSLYQVLSSFYNVEFSNIEKKIYAVNSDEETGRLLEIREKNPVLQIDAVTKGKIANEDRVFEVYRAYVLTDKICFHTNRSDVV